MGDEAIGPENVATDPFENARDMLKILALAPDSQLDSIMTKQITELLEKPTFEWKMGVYEILDNSVRYALASQFTIIILDRLWRSLGGKTGDPAPWRSSYMGRGDDTIDSEVSEE